MPLLLLTALPLKVRVMVVPTSGTAQGRGDEYPPRCVDAVDVHRHRVGGIRIDGGYGDEAGRTGAEGRAQGAMAPIERHRRRVQGNRGNGDLLGTDASGAIVPMLQADVAGHDTGGAEYPHYIADT
jgi:hypothetical protein